MLTIFTPTYNRKHTLGRLYHSLVSQTNQDFEWLIVDDGSTDDTEGYINELMKENKIKIRYYYQENMGKMQAHNKGVRLTNTELFVCVDSDDYLTNTAVEEIINCWNTCEKNDIIGIIAYKKNIDGKTITQLKNNQVEISTIREASDKYGLSGDTMFIYRTDIINRVSFPKFEGENFVPEIYLYDCLDQMGKMKFLKSALCVCEYLPDGYSSNITRLLLKNKQGMLLYLKTRLSYDTEIKQKIVDTIRYIGYCIAVKEKNIIQNSPYKILTALMFQFGYVFYLLRYKRFITEEKYSEK